MQEYVILVDENDNEIGTEEKLKAHQLGLLHRAFSVCLFNLNGEMLLQQRAAHKYHSPLLWTNACCSHPRQGEQILDAANRRIYEEMGIKASMIELFSFTYQASFENGLTEHEFDHVFVGHYSEDPIINREEVHAFKWKSIIDIKRDMKIYPQDYTAWFKILIEQYADKLLAYESL